MKDPSIRHDIAQIPESYWRTYPVQVFPVMAHDESTRIGVIGGGIAGIISAYLLVKSGKNVALIESRGLISGVTGHTTAKITAQHGLIYKELIQTFSIETARLYYEANNEGLHLLEKIVQELAIDCDFEKKEAVIYATTSEGVAQIKEEAKAYEEIGISAVFIEGPLEELPFETKAALIMPNQAQFHPVKFLSALLQEIQRLGGKVYERTRAVDLQEDTVVVMENGTKLTCEKVVVATHYPFNDFDGLYFSKLAVSRSYALAAKTAHPIPEGMYISVDSPTRSLRSIRGIDGEKLLLIGGEGHPAGKSKSDTQTHYENLEVFGREFFSIQEVPFHWSAQDMTTLDKIPYIGLMSHHSQNILVATGFNKWGMTTGAISGKILADLIAEQPNYFADLFSPTRSKLKTEDIKQFIIKNATVGKDLIVSRVQKTDLSLTDLQPDQGGLVAVDGEKLGGYRDEDGQLYLVKTACTHMGCGLSWNNAERSWDCPCHGSRFSYKGEILEGPAIRPLEKITLKE